MHTIKTIAPTEGTDTTIFDRLTEEAQLARLEARLLDAAAKVHRMRGLTA